jgi:hypothetical protein
MGRLRTERHIRFNLKSHAALAGEAKDMISATTVMGQGGWSCMISQ